MTAEARSTPIDAIAGKVLVADDHAVFRFGLVRLLSEKLRPDGCIEAESFDDALGHLEDADVRLAIFDLDMPGLESAHALIDVRRRRPDVCVVVLSGSKNRSDILAALEAGVHGYIVKTEGMDRLVDRLSLVLSGEIYVPPVLADIAKVPLFETVSCEVDGRGPPRRGSPASSPFHATASKSASADQSLSPRQREVLAGLVHGLTNKQIARHLELAEGTVKMHVGAILRALGASNRAHAAALGRNLVV